MIKNKYQFILLCFLLSCPWWGQAQTSKASLGFSGGYVPNGFGIEASFNYNHNRTDFYRVAVLAAIAEEPLETGLQIPYNNYLLNVGYFSKLVNNPSTGVSLAIGGGVSLGYEHINNGENLLSDGSILLSESGFVYGLLAGTDFDLFLSNSISLFVPMNFVYQFNSDLGNAIFYGGIGARISLIQ